MDNGNKNNDENKNIINMAEARKRQKTLRGASKKAGMNGKAPAQANSVSTNKIWGYLQFFMFLALMAYLMKLCSH